MRDHSCKIFCRLFSDCELNSSVFFLDLRGPRCVGGSSRLIDSDVLRIVSLSWKKKIIPKIYKHSSLFQSVENRIRSTVKPKARVRQKAHTGGSSTTATIYPRVLRGTARTNGVSRYGPGRGYLTGGGILGARRSDSMGTKRAHLCRRSADLFWTERISRGAEERGTGPRC